MSDGYIRVYRKTDDDPIFEGEPFDKYHAWIWMISRANYKPTRILFGGKIITLKRGQFVTSVRKMSDKFGWSTNKTLRFLRLLESNGMIRKRSNTEKTLITIEKYSVYQDSRNTNGDTNDNTNDNTNESQRIKRNKGGGSERSETVRPPQETNVDFYHIPLGEPDELPTIK